MTRWTEGGIGKRERDGSVCDRDILARIINPHADRYVVESIPESSLLSASPAREKPRLSMREEFAAAEMVCIVENIFEDGQWAVLEWRDPLGLRGCGFFHVVNGKILFQRGYWDKLSFLRQHGLPLE